MYNDEETKSKQYVVEQAAQMKLGHKHLVQYLVLMYSPLL